MDDFKTIYRYFLIGFFIFALIWDYKNGHQNNEYDNQSIWDVLTGDGDAGDCDGGD